MRVPSYHILPSLSPGGRERETYVQTISVTPPPSRIKVVGLNLIATVTDPRPLDAGGGGGAGVVGVEGGRAGIYTGAG